MFIQEILNSQGYFITNALANAIEVALSTRPTPGAFLVGPAGSGKSQLPQALGKAMEREVIFFQCFPGTREDDLMVKLIPDEGTISGIKAIDGPVMEAAKASLTRPVFLVLDEWDKTRPSADSFLLDFLQSGRIRFNGHSCVANTQNLTVWVTMNNEREISEPLLRRLPLITFSHLPASLVREALRVTHEEHPYLEAAIILYERCLMAGMPKPATIQELRQLLDAISLLGDRADWDALVFQFVTKTRENHELLRLVENSPLRQQVEEERGRLNPEAYEIEIGETTPEEARKPQLPRISEAKKMSSVSEEVTETSTMDDLINESIGGILPLSDDSYDTVVSLTASPSPDPLNIGDVGDVVGSHIVLRQALPLSAEVVKSFKSISEGEVVLIEPSAELRDILSLRTRGWKIVKFSTKEVLAKAERADLRWTPDAGAEIVARLPLYLPGILGMDSGDCSDKTSSWFIWREQACRNSCSYSCRGTIETRLYEKEKTSPSQPPTPPTVKGEELQKFLSLVFNSILRIWGDPQKIKVDSDGEVHKSILPSSRFYPNGAPNTPESAKSIGIYNGLVEKIHKAFLATETKIRSQYETHVELTGEKLTHLLSWANIDLSEEEKRGYEKYLANLQERSKREVLSC